MRQVADTPRMPNHPRHLLRRAHTCSSNQVALVLSVLVVHHHEKLAACERRQRVFHGVKTELGAR